MPEVRQGEIWLYEPPTVTPSQQIDPNPLHVASGHEQTGLRPYIIVSRDLLNKGASTAVAVPMSKNTSKANAYRIALPVAELIPDVGKYPFQPSVALCDHVRVIDLKQMRTRLGKLSGNALTSVLNIGLAYVFDFR